MRLNNKLIGCLLLVTVAFTGCEKRDLYKGGGELTKGDIFDFSTTNTVKLNISYQVPEGMRVYFEAYTENPVIVDEFGNYVVKEGLKPFLKGHTDKNAACRMSVNLPAFVTDVYVYSPMVGVPVLMSGKIADHAVSPEQVAVQAKSMTKAGNDGNLYYENWVKQNFKFKTFSSYDKKGTPDNLLNPGIQLDKQTLEMINATIAKEVVLGERFYVRSDISLSEASHVKLHYVSNGASRKNALAYYTYMGDRPTQKWINENLTLLYPNLHHEALKMGDGVQLKYKEGNEWKEEFPAGVKIGFVLLVDAWKNKSVATNTNAVYSNSSFNKYRLVNKLYPGENVDRFSVPQMTLFKANGHVILAFEDQPWTYSSKFPKVYLGDFIDDVFVLESDPITALPPIEEGETPKEPEGTLIGVTNGIMAFEDVWPWHGDYDLNDVVVKYASGLYFDADNVSVTAAVDTFTFLHNGAKYENGFGYELPTTTDNIEKIEFFSTYQCQGQGLDASLDRATVMLFDNAKNVPVGTVFYVNVWYKEPISEMAQDYSVAPYNPFITISGFLENGRTEVHLINHRPTAKAKMALLHTGVDLSNVANGVYYVSNGNYPFAINMSDADEYHPVETYKIDDIYPRFSSWAKSGGMINKDWYK